MITKAVPASYSRSHPTGALYNVTVTQPTGHGNIIVYPDGLPGPPIVSNVNYSEGQTVANSVLAPMTNGKEEFYNAGTATTQLIADLFGYFANPVATDAPPAGPFSMAVRAQH
jgi:hypothetical protein